MSLKSVNLHKGRWYLMQLSELLQSIFLLPPNMNCDIHHLTMDSRQIKPQSLFFALKGTQTDGCQFIADAIAKGATAILVSDTKQQIQFQDAIPIIHIPHLPQKIGEIAARFYDFPSQKMAMIGVTGTNGKTSCTHFLAEVLSNLQVQCGLIGTLGSGFYGALQETGYTTPDAITLQSVLKSFKENHAKMIAMEVSSHSIDQGRINAIDFDVGVFTNLTQDHLDYHGTMENYANVKKRFLSDFPIKHLILNADDPYGKKWLQEFSHPSILAYSLQEPSTKYPPLFAKNYTLTLEGINAEIVSPWGNANLKLPLIGEFNLSNALAVLASLCVMNIPFKIAIQELQKIHSVPGRMQVIKEKDKPLVIVDYSHTPDSLQKALQALRAHMQGKLICVFGCGGNRDTSKRPIMARIAEKLADLVIVTNDNPRHESPDAIAEQIMSGFLHPKNVIIELDRSKAIKKSIELANELDCILIAGKGAESYQQIGDEKIPFDDSLEVRRNFLRI